MDNMELYNAMREVPKEAMKTIGAGRLKGMSDINPMWRLKKLTEVFGPCGFGWRIEIVKMWLEPGASGVVAAFVQIALYVKVGDEWSAAIPGIGGSSFVAQEKNGMYTSDEAYKMAYTDAISVACKSLGMAADVYYANDCNKYTDIPQPQQTDNRKLLSREQMNSDALMGWIHKWLDDARKNNRRTSLANLVNGSYIVTNEDLKVISESYQQYIVNNNLPY